VKSTSLPLGKYVKIQPQSASFLEISDPRAVLEQSFRHFSALTTGDVFSIMYNDSTFDILVMETKPSPTGISVIETDLEVFLFFLVHFRLISLLRWATLNQTTRETRNQL
jgi:ubiquitin fusion degradation protein 1